MEQSLPWAELFEIHNDILEKGDELVKGCKLELFSGCMDPAESRPEGDHVQVGELFKEKTALKTGMDCLHLRIRTEEPAV